MDLGPGAYEKNPCCSYNRFHKQRGLLTLQPHIQDFSLSSRGPGRACILPFPPSSDLYIPWLVAPSSMSKAYLPNLIFVFLSFLFFPLHPSHEDPMTTLSSARGSRLPPSDLPLILSTWKTLLLCEVMCSEVGGLGHLGGIGLTPGGAWTVDVGSPSPSTSRASPTKYQKMSS